MFHKHYYQPLVETNPSIIYCDGCGDMRHEHEWEQIETIVKSSDKKSIIGNVSRCSICGRQKNFFITD